MPDHCERMWKAILGQLQKMTEFMLGPDEFLLGLVAPDAVDYLRLTDNFRQLDRLADGAWDCARVNP